MEEVTLRFSHLGEKIFAQLDNLSLARSREVSKTWKTFLDQQKFLHIRSIQSYIEKKHKIGEPWKNFFKKSNKKMILMLNSAFKEVCSRYQGSVLEDIIANPLYVAAISGQKYLYQYIEEKVEDKSTKDESGLNPIHYAVINGQLDLFKYIIDNNEDKNPKKDKYGNTVLHSAAR